MRREIAPLADLLSLLRLCWLLYRLKPDMTEFSTPKAGLLGSIAAMLCGVPTRVYFLRGLKLETCTGIKRRILLAAERTAVCLFPCRAVQQRQPAQRGACAGCWRRRANCACWATAAATASMWSDFIPGRTGCVDGLALPQDAHVVGFVGRLTRDKGLPELVEAFDTILAAQPQTRICCWSAGLTLPKTRSAMICACGSEKPPADSFDRVRRRYGALLPRDGCDGFADMARRVSECRSGSGSERDSCCDNLVYRIPRLRCARGDRAFDSSWIPGCYLRIRAPIAAQSRAPLQHGEGCARLGTGPLCE